jgi:hypothetical protein
MAIPDCRLLPRMMAQALCPPNGRACSSGVRLDERGEGTGLGLAIVQDVLNAYGWRLDLAKSELGGLKATIAPSLARQ